MNNGKPHETVNCMGKLNASEFQAYAHVCADLVLKPQIEAMRSWIVQLNTLEHRIVELAVELSLPPQGTGTLVTENEGEIWEVKFGPVKNFLGETLLCSREFEGETEYAVIERNAPGSSQLNIYGPMPVVGSDNDPVGLIRDYIERERMALVHCHKPYLASLVEEFLGKKGVKSHSVVQAVLSYCSVGYGDEIVDGQGSQSKGIKI